MFTVGDPEFKIVPPIVFTLGDPEFKIVPPIVFTVGDPEFISGIGNVSVAVGRDASLSCHISNNQVNFIKGLYRNFKYVLPICTDLGSLIV